MSATHLARDQHLQNENRRLYARRRFEQLTYATFGPGNGGILLNISEGGLSFQGVGIVAKDQFVRLNFKLPGMNTHIEATGQVVWSTESGKGGGLRFPDLPEETRQRVREWIAGDASSAGPFTGQVTTNSGAVDGLGASEENLAQSLPAFDAKGRSEPASIESDPRASEPWQIYSSAAAEATVSNYVSTLARRAPRILAETDEPEAKSARKPQFVVFAAGVLAGCAVVLAAIAGIRMLGGAGRPTTPGEAQSSAMQGATVPGSQSSPLDGIVLNDGRGILSNKSVDTTPAADQGFIGKFPRREEEASGLAARSEPNASPPQDSRQKNMTDHANLALQAPHTPMLPARAELREPSTADGVPSGFISMDEPREVVPSMPDLPKPPQPSPETVDRTASFLEAVPIERGTPVYPPTAKKKHIGGLVRVSATIGADGVPRELKPVSGDPELAQAAQEAISRWRYVPAVLGGVPVESHTVITINFQSKP
jgi:TonB family protein